MLARKCTMEDLEKALASLNETYLGNVRFYEARQAGRHIRFRLKTAACGVGTSRRASWKRTGSACWHVHGNFFETLFKLKPDAVIVSKHCKITKDYGNWEDYNVGSQANSLYASEACDCDFSEALLGRVAGEAELVDRIRGLDLKGVEELMESWGGGHTHYGELILRNCRKDILPCYATGVNEKLRDIVAKRLRNG